jgi:hypothetical protein
VNSLDSKNSIEYITTDEHRMRFYKDLDELGIYKSSFLKRIGSIINRRK